MGGKSSKGSVGSASASASGHNLTSAHHRAASMPPMPCPTALSPRHAAVVEAKLVQLEQVYVGIAASAVISKTGELLHGRGLDTATATEVRSLFPRFVSSLSGFERSLDDADVRFLHIYGALRCFSCFRMDEKHFLLFFTTPVDSAPRTSVGGPPRPVAHHTAAQDERAKQLCVEIRQALGDTVK